MSGIEGIEGLQAFAIFLRELGPTLQGEGCRAAAKDVGEVAAEQYAVGKGPSDKVWPLRKADGAIALQRPTSEIKWTARRGAIVATADDVVLHHRGKRPVFPFDSRRLPPRWLEAAESALERTVEQAFAEVAG